MVRYRLCRRQFLRRRKSLHRGRTLSRTPSREVLPAEDPGFNEAIRSRRGSELDERCRRGLGFGHYRLTEVKSVWKIGAARAGETLK